LKRAVSDNLVGVHIGSCTCTTLNHIARELVVVLSIQDFKTSLRDTIELSVSQKTELMVSLGSAQLGHCQAIDKQRIVVKMKTANWEILDTTLCLHTIESLYRHLHLAEKIALNASFT